MRALVAWLCLREMSPVDLTGRNPLGTTAWENPGPSPRQHPADIGRRNAQEGHTGRQNPTSECALSFPGVNVQRSAHRCNEEPNRPTNTTQHSMSL